MLKVFKVLKNISIHYNDYLKYKIINRRNFTPFNFKYFLSKMWTISLNLSEK